MVVSHFWTPIQGLGFHNGLYTQFNTNTFTQIQNLREQDKNNLELSVHIF